MAGIDPGAPAGSPRRESVQQRARSVESAPMNLSWICAVEFCPCCGPRFLAIPADCASMSVSSKLVPQGARKNERGLASRSARTTSP